MNDCPYCGDPCRPKQQTCGAEICEEVLGDELHAVEIEGQKPTAFECWLNKTIIQTFGKADSEMGVSSGLASLYEAGLEEES